MITVLKLIGFLCLFCFVGLASFAYVAPTLGIDLAPPKVKVSIPLATPIE